MATGSIDNLLMTYFNDKFQRHLNAAIFPGEIGLIEHVFFDDEVETTREEPMTQMQPKELLVHLEKGDRTDEFVEPHDVRDVHDAVNMMRNANAGQSVGDIENMTRYFMQSSHRLGMASAGISSSELGRPQPW